MLELAACSEHEPADVAAIQQLLEAAPAYTLLVEGRLPQPGDGYSAISDLPPDTARTDKFFGAFSEDGKIIGCLDLVRGYPEQEIAFLGLLLFAETHQGKGYGLIGWQHAVEMARAWNCQQLRLAVIETNQRGLKFWQRLGFCELYRKAMPAYTGDAIVLEIAL